MAVYPTILVDSGTGSDSLASGAGPGTARNGTAAATDGVDGKTVTISDTVDLSGVATDGSAAIYIADATAGHRNFDQITAVSGGPSGSPWTLTVANGFSLSLSGKSWAIGGIRASIGGTDSKKLFDNNGAAGDAMPGWAVEMQSGHAENLSAAFSLRRAGNTTNGGIELRGASGAAVLPCLTWTSNTEGIITRGQSQRLKNFELQNSSALKTAARAVVPTVALGIVFEGLKIDHATNNWLKGIDVAGVVGVKIIACDIGHTTDVGIDNACAPGLKLLGNWIHDTGGGAGVRFQTGTPCYSTLIYGNVFYNCAGTSLIYENNRSDALGGCTIAHNTFDTSSSDAIKTTTAAKSLSGLDIFNNIFSHSGSYHLEFNDVSITDAYLDGLAPFIRGNDTFVAVSGAYKSATGSHANDTCPWSSGDPGLDPGFSSISTGDASIGTSLKAKGWPLAGALAIGTYSSTYSYVDIGAAQRQEAGGGGGLLVGNSFRGGML
jgi:hypothetical protein